MTVLPYIFKTILQFIIIICCIYGFRVLLQSILKSKPIRKRAIYYFNVFTYFIWIVFVMIKISDAAGENPIFSIPIILILLFFMWDFLKNFFLGIIFSFQYGFLEDTFVVINNKQGKITNLSSSYFELFTNNGKQIKIKYKEVYNGRFEIFKGELNRIHRKIKRELIKDIDDLKIKIMNHPLFLLNSSFKFSEEIDENGVEWFRFYFNVVNYKEAKEINTYLNHILSPKPSSFN